jgi:arylsulfatase A-like enzyme
MVSWPGHVEGDVTSDALVEIIDVYPTLLEALGIDLPVRCQGRSLFPVLNEPESPFRESQLSEISFSGERRICIRTSENKYAVRQNGDGYMLYDLSMDPDEQHNLIGRGRDLEREMRDLLLRRILGSQYVMDRRSPDFS